jgi:hypothetical protein
LVDFVGISTLLTNDCGRGRRAAASLVDFVGISTLLTNDCGRGRRAAASLVDFVGISTLLTNDRGRGRRAAASLVDFVGISSLLTNERATPPRAPLAAVHSFPVRVGLGWTLVAEARAMRPGAWSSLERLLARQHGVVALWQVAALGIPRPTFIDYVHRHGWSKLCQGIWAAPWSERTFAQRCVVECIRGQRARLITGGAVMTLLGARRLETSTIDLWVRPGLSVARRPGVVVYRSPWVSGDRVTRVDGVLCTPPLRALRDAAWTSSVARLERDLRALDRLRLATPEQAQADLRRRGRFPGKPKLVQALRSVGAELVHSDAEADGRRLIRALPLALHPRPLLVRHGSLRLGEIDLPMCDIRYGVEIDGPAHREDGEPERDQQRDALLMRRTHWLIDRFPHDLLTTDPAAFVEGVRVGAAKAAARGVEPWPCEVCRLSGDTG